MKKAKGKRMLALLLAGILTVTGGFGMSITAKADTCGGLLEEDIYDPKPGEVIKDPVLHWAVRASLNSIKDAPLLTEEIVGAKQVSIISYELCAHPEDFETWEKQYWIENLEGIQYAKSASMVDICYTSAVEGKRIADVSPLSALVQLDALLLKQDGISDIRSLKTLVNLTQLDVSGNHEIEDVSAIANMKQLKQLNLSGNRVKDISAVEGLTELEFVAIADNQIEGLPDLSKLVNVYSLDASHNSLTDISEIAGLKGLKELNLTGNKGITDYKPLARLLSLEKDKTSLPENANKEDIFAAIEVNKLFDTFNISLMKEADLENVDKALAAYEDLTETQKEYVGTARAEAAAANKKKVENGEEPEYYPEYDEGGTKQPVLDRLEIQALDKRGNPMPDVTFIKKALGATQYTTDQNGMIYVNHAATDAYWDLSIRPEGDKYVAIPSEIVYEVKDKKTYTINGKPATGFEELRFVLIPKEEYVDKSGLAAVLKEAEAVKEEYIYTAESYQAYRTALQEAQKVYEDVDAVEAEVSAASEKLRTALDGLAVSDILTELKLIVKDSNGNTFTRPFKFQIRVPGTGADAWNQLSNAETGLVYLQASPAWQDGKVWEILACHEEPYTVEPVTVTVGVSPEGTRYFKTVNGEAVKGDFELEVTVIARPGGAIDKDNERKPDGTVLQQYVEAVGQYAETDYTPATYQALQEAIQNAQAVLDKSGAVQEEYNAAAAALREAKNALTEPANKAALQKEIEKYYVEDRYTEESWSSYAEALANAKAVNGDLNASQAEVDEALSGLKQAEDGLVLKADKSELGQKLEEAKALKAEDYSSGYEELQAAIETAQAVYDNENAAQVQINEQVDALEQAMAALVEKPMEVDYVCYSGLFRARVTDEDGNPLAGVQFQSIIDGSAEEGKLTSDSNGIITYYVSGPNRGKTTYIQLADEAYTTEDKHYFEADGPSQWIVSMQTIDGQPYTEGIHLNYVLKEAGGDTPQPPVPGEKVLSDSKTFRAKVVDAEGNPVSGVIFTQTPDFDDVSLPELTSNEKGILEYSLGADDYALEVMVALKAGQSTADGSSWNCTEKHSYQTSYITTITHIDSVALAEAGEIVFTLQKEGTDIPEPAEVKKDVLQEEINIARLFDGKEADYTEESYQALQAAIAEAEEVYNDPQADQETVDACAEKLKEVRLALKKAEKPVVCDASNIRILVVDEEGNPVTDRIAFSRTFDNGYPGSIYTTNGVLEYNLSTADDGIGTIAFFLKDGSTTLDGKEYVVEPEMHEFSLSSSTLGTEVAAIDGIPLNGTQEVKFVLREKEAEPEVDKTELQAALEEMKAIDGSSYTLNSYQALQSAITEAEQILADEQVSQEAVDQAVQTLLDAKTALKEVTGMRTLTIPVIDQDGSPAPLNTKFIRYDVKYGVENNIYAIDGQLVWKPGSYDGGDYEFYLPEDSAYIATPAVIKVHIGNEDGTPVIETINGVSAAEAAPQFRITPKQNDACDLLTFRAFVQDQEGQAVSGVAFQVENGDPAELVSDENGMIEYHVTAWDTETTMTVTLKEGQGWENTDAAVFSVITDPEDENRGIIDTVNGTPVAESGKIVFVLKKEEPKPEVDKTALQAAMEEAGKLDASKYTEESFAKVTGELERAVSVYADEDATQEAVNAQTEALRAAMDALVEKEEPKPEVDKTELKEAIDKAEALDASKYTEESYAEVKKALEAAAAVHEDAEANQDTVDRAAKALNAALEALEEKSEGGDTEDTKPSDGQEDGKKPTNDQKQDGKENVDQKTDKAVKTGDTMPTVQLFGGVVVSVLAIYLILRKRRNA